MALGIGTGVWTQEYHSSLLNPFGAMCFQRGLDGLSLAFLSREGAAAIFANKGIAGDLGGANFARASDMIFR